MTNYYLTDSEMDVLRGIQKEIHESCVAAGWYTDLDTGEQKARSFPEAVALMHSELSEALEGHRKNLMDDHLPDRRSIEVELADCIIRILDTAGHMDLDVAGAMQEKFAYNQQRADHKIENRRGANGKKI